MDDNSYFERREYDGAEYWFHKNPLREPHTTFHLSADTFNYIDAKHYGIRVHPHIMFNLNIKNLKPLQERSTDVFFIGQEKGI